MTTEGILQQFDHKLIGQIGERSVEGICVSAMSLIMSKYCSSRCRL